MSTLTLGLMRGEDTEEPNVSLVDNVRDHLRLSLRATERVLFDFMVSVL